MAAGLPDLVDCVRLAEESAVLEREYELRQFVRLSDLLAAPQGKVRARFAFATLGEGRSGAQVSVQAAPVLTCQRCLQGFGHDVNGSSLIEFTHADDAQGADAEREVFRIMNGLVSLRELVEEELLLALPIAPACSAPQTCGRAPTYVTGDAIPGEEDALRRPFSVLQDLLKKT